VAAETRGFSLSYLRHHQSDLCPKHQLEKSIGETNRRIKERLKKMGAKEKKRVTAKANRTFKAEKARKYDVETQRRADEDRERKKSKSASKNPSIKNLISG
jgi:hypothetical protein